MYAGYMDKVLKYSAKALAQVERLKGTKITDGLQNNQ